MSWYRKWQVWLSVAIVLLVTLGCILISNIAGSANHRNDAIEDFVSLYQEIYPESYPEGSITWEDKGGIVEITRVQADSNSSLNYFGIDDPEIQNVEEDQVTVDMLAFQLGCPVITYDRLNDGLLFAIQVGYPDDSSRAVDPKQDLAVQSRIDTAVEEAVIEVGSRQGDLLSELCEGIKAAYGKTVAKTDYLVEGDTVRVEITLAPGYDFVDGTDSTEAYMKAFAESDSRILHKGVIFQYYSSNGTLLLQADSPLVDYYITPRDLYGSEEA